MCKKCKELERHLKANYKSYQELKRKFEELAVAYCLEADLSTVLDQVIKMEAIHILSKRYRFWIHIPKIGPDEFKIEVPGKSENEAKKNFSILLKSIRKNQIYVK